MSERIYEYATVKMGELPERQILVYRGRRVVRDIQDAISAVMERGDLARVIVLGDDVYEALTGELWAFNFDAQRAGYFPSEVLGLPIAVVPMTGTLLVCGTPERDFTARVVSARAAAEPEAR